jgi:pectin methylesterase-like acyl-CoA thioesterase
MLQTQARGVFLAIASLCASLACSSSTDNPQGKAGSSGQSTSASAGNSASTSAVGGGGTSAAGSGGISTSSRALGGTGGFKSSATGWTGGTQSSSDTGNSAGSTALGSDSGGASAGATPGGATASGGTSAAGGRSTVSVAGASAGRSSGGTGVGGTTGGTTNTGGTSGTGGATGANDSLCPPGITRTIAVAKDGSGQFNSVQAAVNSITSGSSARIRIDIKAGTYTEKLTIASRTNLCLVGANATSTILSYGDSNASTGGTSTSASVHISADDFSAANLTFQNTYGSGSQAVALRTTGNRQQFLNCRFVGYQDTLYTHDGSQYFRNCYVQGNTDYVFGGATAVLQDCEVRNVENGSAVAAPNTDASTAYGIVFLGGKFTAVAGVKSVALGRPWGADGFSAYLNVDLGSHILPAGFVVMSGNQPQNARFHEYGSTGSGANSSSRSSYQLTAAQAANYTLTKIFGSWTPTYSQ